MRGESEKSNFEGTDSSAFIIVQPRGCDPIDGELYLGCVKPSEISVEALSRSDVQFDGVTWV